MKIFKNQRALPHKRWGPKRQPQQLIGNTMFVRKKALGACLGDKGETTKKSFGKGRRPGSRSMRAQHGE